ncbi:MAG: hypothetical protein QXW01_02710 [Candidatus Aenigmatarchaeota archaeon]
MREKNRSKKFYYYLITLLLFLLSVSFYLFKTNMEREESYIIISSTGEINFTIEKEKNETIIKVDYSCNKDEDCYLISTNCCPESSGANWECVGKNSIIYCDLEGILCPNVQSPRPNFSCRCINNFCVPE